jgi:hypothetical protein
MNHRSISNSRLLGFGMAAAFALGACGRTTPDSAPQGDGSQCIMNEQGTECLPVAPESERVDLAVPAFSDPTTVTNPLHPTATTKSILMLGSVDGLPFRTEVTLLPETKIIEWNGQQIEALVSQYAAFQDGRILEVALDWYAQADDGSVWYLGEDVFNYEDGVVADTHGTWIAGPDAPGAMIMPANPQLGDVYRPENAPGVVFEEVTVKSVGETRESPHGPVTGAIIVRELHKDGSTEDKTFAPGYGEFSTGGGGDLEAVALAVPIDALDGPVPAELETLTSGAGLAFAAAQSEDWEAAAAALSEMSVAWEDYQAGQVPPMIEEVMNDAIKALTDAVRSGDPAEAARAAIRVAQSGLDLQLRYSPPVEIDLARFELWTRQLGLDVAAGDAAAVAGDVAAMEWPRDRFAHTLASADRDQLDALLGELRIAADDEELQSAAEVGVRLGAFLAGLTLQV